MTSARSRPTKDTPECRKVIIKALEAGNTRTAACQAAGISLDTLARMLARDADFCGLARIAEAKAEMKAVANVKAAFSKQWQSAAWWLERRRPDEWGKVDRVEITIRERAEKLARELGMNVDDLVREAERIAANA